MNSTLLNLYLRQACFVCWAALLSVGCSNSTGLRSDDKAGGQDNKATNDLQNEGEVQRQASAPVAIDGINLDQIVISRAVYFASKNSYQVFVDAKFEGNRVSLNRSRTTWIHTVDGVKVSTCTSPADTAHDQECWVHSLGPSGVAFKSTLSDRSGHSVTGTRNLGGFHLVNSKLDNTILNHFLPDYWAPATGYHLASTGTAIYVLPSYSDITDLVKIDVGQRPALFSNLLSAGSTSLGLKNFAVIGQTAFIAGRKNAVGGQSLVIYPFDLAKGVLGAPLQTQGDSTDLSAMSVETFGSHDDAFNTFSIIDATSTTSIAFLYGNVSSSAASPYLHAAKIELPSTATENSQSFVRIISQRAVFIDGSYYLLVTRGFAVTSSSMFVLKCTPTSSQTCADPKFIPLNLPQLATRSAGVMWLAVGTKILTWGSGDAATAMTSVVGDGAIFDTVTEKSEYVAPDEKIATARTMAQGFFVDGTAIIYGSAKSISDPKFESGNTPAFAFDLESKRYLPLKLGTFDIPDDSVLATFGGVEVTVGSERKHYVLRTYSKIQGNAPTTQTDLYLWNSE